MHPCKSSFPGGFSLVEMAVVLIIIGLIVGGVLMGSNLMRAAEIRSIAEEEQRIVAAVHAFQDKYASLPGDMYNATEIWGEQDPNPATCRVTASTGRATCNGNGNGTLKESTASYEFLRFWQHLANAGMLEGRYTGMLGPVANGLVDPDLRVGLNTPPGPINGTGIEVYWEDDIAGHPYFFDGHYGNHLYFGTIQQGSWPERPMLTTGEALSFDQKYDDGKPGTGKIRSSKPAMWAPNCADSDVAATARYKTSYEDLACQVIFPDVF